jgi:hypothetical protein
MYVNLCTPFPAVFPMNKQENDIAAMRFWFLVSSVLVLAVMIVLAAMSHAG